MLPGLCHPHAAVQSLPLSLQAVCEGRWLVIENIDLAPPDVLASLCPLLEGRALHLPNRAAAIDPAPGFQLIGTVTQSLSGEGQMHTFLAESAIGASGSHDLLMRQAYRYVDQVCDQLTCLEGSPSNVASTVKSGAAVVSIR